MADLNSLYQETGLQGILPYAFTRNGKGYQFLCEKLKEGAPFYILSSRDMLSPFVMTGEGKVYFALYSSESFAMANAKCDKLAMDKFYVEAVSIEPGEQACALFKRYRDLGITHLYLDEFCWVDIRDLAPPATYDGLLSLKAPLRNAQLNAALYYMMQHMQAGIPCDPIIKYFWDLLKEGHLYVPVRPNSPLRPGEKLDLATSDLHLLEMEDGSITFQAFTDPEFTLIYAESMGLNPEEYTAGFTPGLADIKQYMFAHPDQKLLLNAFRGNFIFTLKTFEEMEMVALNQSAKESH